jgi:hypothetical protein
MTIEQLREYQAQYAKEQADILAKFDALVADFQQFKKLYNGR